MKIIGITGGVGSGKSRILSFLEERYGAVICQADQVAWKLQEPGTRCYQKIVKQFGDGILNEDETINRKKVGAIVFGNQEKLRALNAIMHPAVKDVIRDEICKELEKGTKLFVLEAALLIEEKYDEICDELWYIYTSEPIRRQRLRESRGYSDEKMNHIMASQLSDEMFRNSCQRMIDNSDEFDKTCAQIALAIEQLGEN